MLVEFNLLFMCISSTLGTLDLSHFKQTAETVALGSHEATDRLSWGLDLKLGSEVYFDRRQYGKKRPNDHVANKAPNDSPFQERGIFNLDLISKLSGNAATSACTIENDSTCVGNCLSKKRKMIEEAYSYHPGGLYSSSLRIEHAPFRITGQERRSNWDTVTNQQTSTTNNREDMTYHHFQGPLLNTNKKNSLPVISQLFDIQMLIGRKTSQNDTGKSVTSLKNLEQENSDKMQDLRKFVKGKIKTGSTKQHESTNVNKPHKDTTSSSTNIITPNDQESEKPTKIVRLGELSNWITAKAGWLEANISKIKRPVRYVSVYAALELVGREILQKLGIVPRKYGYESKLQIESARTFIQAHSIKSIVTYIKVINDLFEPPLFDSKELLEKSQREAVIYVDEFWHKFKQQRISRDESHPSFGLLFNSPEEKVKFENMFECQGFSTE